MPDLRLLLSEDNVTRGRVTCVFMMRDGCAVDCVTNGNQRLSLLDSVECACMSLDLDPGLPELGGDDCLVNMRNHGNATQVVVATARGFREDRIGMLDIGADDYLVKPCALAELSACIKAILRRNCGVVSVKPGAAKFRTADFDAVAQRGRI